jgi:hypothetical protein
MLRSLIHFRHATFDPSLINIIDEPPPWTALNYQPFYYRVYFGQQRSSVIYLLRTVQSSGILIYEHLGYSRHYITLVALDDARYPKGPNQNFEIEKEAQLAVQWQRTHVRQHIQRTYRDQRASRAM